LFGNSDNWEFRETGIFYDSYLQINTFNLTSINLDLNKFKGTFNPFVEVTSDGNQVFNLTFQFNYIGRTSYFKKKYGTGSIKISDFQFRYNKRELFENTTSTALFLGLNIDCDLNDDSSDETLKLYFAKIKADHLVQIKAILIQKVNSYIDSYYRIKTNDNVISLETMIPNFNYSYTFNYIQPPSYVNNSGVNYFLKGNLKRLQSKNYLLVQSNNRIDDEYSFDAKDGDIQIFLPNTLLRKVFTDFSTTQKISFTLNQTDLVPEFNFLLNIDYLGMIVPEIYKYKARDEKIRIKGTFDELDFNTESKSLNCKIYFNIYDSNEKMIFSWKTDIQFRFSSLVNLEESSLNFVISDIRVTDITFLQNDFGEADILTLIGWIEDSFSIMNKRTGFSLFKTNINLKKYILIKETKEVPNKGLLLIA